MVGWRKWGMTLAVVLGAFGLCAAGKMADGVAAQLVGAVVVAYFGGNVGAKFAAQRNGNGGGDA
jgi:hypothetical protein